MAKNTAKVTDTPGGRVKRLLFETGKTQEQLAEETGIHRAALNAKLNGKRTLTEGDAEAFAGIFSVNKDWILGTEPFRSEDEQLDAITTEYYIEREQLSGGLRLLAKARGYELTGPRTLQEVLAESRDLDFADACDIASATAYSIKRGDNSVILSDGALYDLANKIADFIAIELEYVIKHEAPLSQQTGETTGRAD